ncbi:MAG: bifunctional glutamate N-acetyltransferase/amino-acid acetyltransferase ArgJ [Treponema sp.]|jgi:glutamate N-acetyltransferase/amino-acid N-acetyltransferase|nr:bifunctional glutamate N-acetyltransferase/amino-acid acetyltransferase ArgJ [Treponema sp.]
MKEISGGVCAPKGFSAGGIRCGIKASFQKKDLALIYSEKTCNAAAMFTKNKVKAASVIVSQENIAGGKLRAIIANSGNANACTGQDGMAAAKRMAQLAADALGIPCTEVAVASTGVIGVPLPVAPIEKNIGALKESLRADELGHSSALEAIMTTDTRKKEIAVEIEIGGKPARIGAMTKGSGMIHPNMATMLTFITTDAAIESAALDSALRLAVAHSFNRMTVDGDTSTNDMVVIMANGTAGNAPVNAAGADYAVFCAALEYVCIMLARKMARDGEGATKLVTVTVTGAASEKNAETLAKSIASSSLVKAACFGADANWGRVLCAMGYAGADFRPEKTDVSFASRAGDVLVCKNGESVVFSEEKAKLVLLEEEIEILVSLHEGDGQASVWGCDLTYDYVKINGDYRS